MKTDVGIFADNNTTFGADTTFFFVLFSLPGRRDQEIQRWRMESFSMARLMAMMS